MDYICTYCGKSCKNDNSHRNHERLCPYNPNRHYVSHTIGATPWNKGLTKDTDYRVKEYADKHLNNTNWLGRHHSLDTRLKLSKCAGGYRHGSGHGKHGVYKGYRCDSSWELAYVIYNLEHDIKFERNRERFLYNLNGKSHYYIPDFMCDGKYIEIKGYINETWNAKVEQFPKDKTLVILYKADMKPYLEYVVNKYGNDFISLYE